MRDLPVVVVVAAGLGVVAGGGAANGQAPTSASIVAADNVFTTAAGGSPNVTIATGGRVDFSYPSGLSSHNVRFTTLLPSACAVSQGPAGSAAALPAVGSPAPWAGSCEFTVAGTYPFVCDVHAAMTGSVTVTGAGPAPPGSSQPPPPPPDPDSTSTPPPPGTPSPPPAQTTAAGSALRVTTRQRGVTVRGSIQVRSAGSRLLARAFVPRRTLSGGRSALRVQVGRQVRAAAPAGRVSFAVPINAAARRALRRKGSLAISLRLTVTPPGGGAAYQATRAVTLRS